MTFTHFTSQVTDTGLSKSADVSFKKEREHSNSILNMKDTDEGFKLKDANGHNIN